MVDLSRLEATVLYGLGAMAAVGGICLVTTMSWALYWAVDVAVGV